MWAGSSEEVYAEAEKKVREVCKGPVIKYDSE